MGTQPIPQKGGRAARNFLAHVYCGQTAGWIKMPLGMEVGLSPGDFILDGYPDPVPKKGAEPPPQFSAHVCCGQTVDESRLHLACRWAFVQAISC